jgi:hypothetical protein
MALPVITNNSPSAGYISWTQTNVTWGSYDFTIPAGNTNKLYTWWEFRNGTPAVVSSDTYPANLLPEDLLLFLNKDGVGMLVPDASVMNGALIVPGTIYAYAIHGDEIQGYHIKSNQIATTHLQADSVVADKVAANAITTEKLAAGAVSDDLVANGSFEDLDTATGLPEGYVFPTITSGTVTVDTANATSGTQCLKITATTTGANVVMRQAPEKYIPVSVANGRKWYVSLRAASLASVTTGMIFKVNWYDSAKALISSTTIASGQAMNTTWTIFEGQIQPVNNTRYMGLEVSVTNPNVATSFFFDELTAREVVMSAMIGDGVITTPKLVAGAVTVDKLTAGSVGNNLVVNGSFEDFDSTLAPLSFTKASEVNGTIQVIQGSSTSGAYSARLNATTTAANLIMRQAPEKYIPVSVAANRKWYVSLRAGTDVSVTTGMTFRVNWYDTAKALLSSTTIVANPAMTNTWAVYEGQVQPVANAKYMALEVQVQNPNVVAQFLVDELNAQEVVVSAMIGDGAITATKVNAGAITAQAIAANAVGAQNLIIADLNNYWQNPDFESEAAGTTPAMGLGVNTGARVKDISAWAGMAGGAPVNGTSAGNGSSRALELDAKSGSNNDVYDTNIFPVSPGDQYYMYFEGRYLNTAGTTGQGRAGFRLYNQAGTAIGWAAAASLGTTKTQFMTPVEGTYQITNGTYFVQPWVTFSDNGETTNKFIVDNIEFRKVNGGELIADGAITATKIKADAVESDKIKANAVTVGKLAAGAVTARSLAIGDFTNLAYGGEFDDIKTLENWNYPVEASYTSLEFYPDALTGGSLQVAAGATVRIISQAKTIPVRPGDVFSFSMQYKTSSDFNGSGNSKFRIGDQSDNLLYSWGIGLATSWTPQTGTYVVPAGVRELKLAIYLDQTVGTAWVDSVTFQRKLNSVQIKDGAISANHVSASAIWSDSSWLGTAGASSLKLVSTNPSVTALDPDGNTITQQTSSEVNSKGLRVINTNTDNLGAVDIQEVIKLGTFDEDFFSINKAGVPQITMNSDGEIATQQLTVGTSDNAGTLIVNGNDLASDLYKRPSGMLAWGQVPIGTNMAVNGGEVGLFEIAFDGGNVPARMAELNVNNFLIESGGAGVVGVRLRMTSDNSAPSITSPIIGYSYFRSEAAGLNTTQHISRIIGSNNGQYLRVLVSLYASGTWAKVYNGGGQSYLYSRVLDLGETIDPTAIATTAGGTPYVGSPYVPPSAPKVTKTVEWGYTGVRSYTGSNAWYNYNTAKGYQGLSPAGYGNLKSIYVFPNTITSTISGSTINGIWLYSYFEHWYNGAGGTARFRLHSNTSVPATYNGSVNGMNSAAWPRAAGRWVAVPSSLWAGFLNGTWKGFGFEGDSTYNTYGIANNARIKITYTK